MTDGEMNSLHKRFIAACHDLHKDVKRGFDAGSNLIGIMELPNGKTAQLHVTMVTDENEFLDVDGVTGCADDLAISESDFSREKSMNTDTNKIARQAAEKIWDSQVCLHTSDPKLGRAFLANTIASEFTTFAEGVRAETWDAAIGIMKPWADSYKSCREHFDDPCCHVRLAVTIVGALEIAAIRKGG